jgi:hypothetical protein
MDIFFLERSIFPLVKIKDALSVIMQEFQNGTARIPNPLLGGFFFKLVSVFFFRVLPGVLPGVPPGLLESSDII